MKKFPASSKIEILPVSVILQQFCYMKTYENVLCEKLSIKYKTCIRMLT